MSRPRNKRNRHLPPRMHLKRGIYYYVSGSGNNRKWIRLGRERHKAYSEYARLVPMEPSGNTFADVAADVVKMHWPKLSERTRQDYNRALENLMTAFRDAPIQQITPGVIGRYMDIRSNKHDANREKAVLSLVFKYGIRWGMMRTNPARLIESHPTKSRKRIITPAEWRAIKCAALDPIGPFMDLAYVTGLRVGDILALRWKQVSEDGLYVLQGKNKAEGVYTLTDDLRAILDACKRLHQDDNVSNLLRPAMPIIHTKAGKPYKYSGIRSAWVRACKRANVEDVHIHDIRRTAITMAKQAGRSPKDFSLHKTEAQASAYVVEVPRVEPLEVLG